MKYSFLEKTLENLEADGLKRNLRKVEGSQGRQIILEGKKVLNFCSNNYLGLADDPRLIESAKRTLNLEGFGSGASRLVCGNMQAHQKLEEKIAEFKETQRALVFSTGYMANVGIIPSLFTRDDIILADKLNHASIIDGIRLSGAKFKRYAHCDMDDLEELLKSSSRFRKRVIITDSVFSMDGDIAPLDRIVELAKKYDALTMIDEAHAFGILGKRGKGAVEHFGLHGQIDIQMGTLSKAVGSFGAYCCGNEDLIDYFINKARSFIYTTGMPPSVAAASLRSIEIIEREQNLLKQLWENTAYIREGIKELGFDVGATQTPIIPIIVKDANLAVEFSQKLFDYGIFVQAIRPPTVPKNTARLRLTVMATHKKEDLDYTLQQLKSIGQSLCLISQPSQQSVGITS